MKLKYIYILLICLPFSIASCDFLDVSDELSGDLDSYEEVFSNVDSSKRWYANAMSGVPDYSDIFPTSEFTLGIDGDAGLRNPWTCLADEINTPSMSRNGMGRTDWNSATEAPHRWNKMYRLIRQCNIFLEMAKDIPSTGTNAAEITKEQMNEYKANVRFMRAYYHYLLFELYGPIPIVRSSFSLDDDMDLERATVDEVVEFIDKELTEVAGELHQIPYTEVDYLAVPNKGVALAVRAKLWMYAASPLFNGEYTPALTLKTSDGRPLFPAKDPSKWQKALDACQDFIDYAKGYYDLFKVMKNGQIDPEASLYELFQSYNSEVIWATSKTGWGGMDGMTFDRRATPVSEPNGLGEIAVLQELVDDFPMKDGLPIKATSYLPKSPLYVEDGSKADYNGVQVNKMFIDRDPRFYNTVMFEGRKWHITNNVIYFHKGSSNDYTKSKFPISGYLLYKRFNRTVAKKSPGVSSKFRPSFVFRLADFYLLYAEALNEVEPSNENVLKYVNLVRERAGLPALEKLNPAIAGDQVLQREAIRMERRIELATEGQRYFDTHRWMIAGNKPGEGGEGGDFHGLNMAGEEAEFFQRTKCETRIFNPEKHYLFPIPLSEMQKSKGRLVQNPKW